jgi:aminoglycoside phosphotransferase (APT) family kinase protein
VRSLTKRDVPTGELRAVTRAAFGPDVELAGWQELTDGTFNTAYALDLSDGRRAVLKVAPPPGLRLLRYEADLMRTEAEFFERAAAAGVPVPAVHHADPDAGYLVLERLSGEPLYAAQRSMPPAALAEVHRELGAVAARLAGVTGPRFGYPRRDGRTGSPRWSTSFLAMVDDVLADGVALGTALPAPAEDIARLAHAHARLLDEVTTPSLVHFDLWDGNVFVRPDGAGWRVEGLIDGERAFYGDPIAELVSLALLRDPADVPGLLPGFLGRDLTAAERTRWRLYSLYLYLIMLTEGVTRGHDPAAPDPIRLLTAERLTALLAGLSGVSPPTG